MLLMTPGPVAVDQRVVAATNRPAITHTSRLFDGVMEDLFRGLRRIFRTGSLVTVLPGSGRVGLESAIASTVEPGEPTVHLVNGIFGEWSVEIARRAGAEVTVVEGRWGEPADLEGAARAVREVRPRLVSMVHSETSTGAFYSLEEMARVSHDYGALFMADVISSLGTMPFDMDALGVDLAVCNSNKGLGSLNGLALVGVSERAYQVMEDRTTPCQSYSLDLRRWKEEFFSRTYPRPYPVAPPTHPVYALREACRLVLEEGLEARWARHRRYAEAVRQAVEAAGLEVFPDRHLAGNCITAVRAPEGIQAGEVVEGMEAQGVLISGTGSRPSPIKGRLFRLSHQGVQASEEMLIPTLVALERTLRSLGYPLVRGAMVAAFEAALEG